MAVRQRRDGKKVRETMPNCEQPTSETNNKKHRARTGLAEEEQGRGERGSGGDGRATGTTRKARASAAL